MTIGSRARRCIVSLGAMVLVLAACGSDDGDTDAAATTESSSDRPTVVVTTNILGDVVTELVGDQADVVTIMPVGADPHDFQPSAQEVDQVLSADALVTNGSSFEEGLLNVIDSAKDGGVPTFEATEAVTTIEFGEGGHDHGHDDEHEGEEGHEDEHEGHDHEGEEGHKDDEDGHDHEGEEGHEDEDKDEHGHEGEEGHEDEHDHEDGEAHEDDEDGHDHDDDEGHDDEGHDEHDHSGDDPHFFTDPARMADAARGIGDFLAAEVDGLDTDALEASVDAYIAELEALDAEVEELVAAISEDQRVLITNHEVFGYFADRYGFEVVGTVIPGGSTLDGTSAGDLAELAEVIEAEGVQAIFSDTSSSNQLIDALADEVGDVAVVELFTESLGDADSEGATYIEMVRTNASRISAALS